MRQVLRELEASGTVRRVDLGGEPPVCWDCDTAADLSRARALV
jgi:hypothetical protein